MTGSCTSTHRVSLRHVALAVQSALAATLFLLASADAAAPLTLQVETSDTLPGFHLGDLPRYLARHMTEAQLPDWRFEPSVAVTIEAKLYLNGEYQTLVEKQAVIQGGADDPDLAAAVADMTQNLLGSKGAFRATDSGRLPAQRPR